MTNIRTIDRLLRQQAALANFGSFAFGETNLQKILSEAARICAVSLGVPYTKICRYRPEQNDLLVVAGYGWESDIIGHVISQADETSTQGRAFVTGEPVILKDIRKNNSYNLPNFYAQHGIISTVDVLIKGKSGPFGVLEADCSNQHTFDEHDINFLTGFANVIAEAVGTSERTSTLQATLIIMQTLITEKEILLNEKETLLEEKNMLAAELQHRVRNNLQLINGMLIKQIEISDDSGKEGIRAIARRVMSLATIYDHLLGHGLMQSIDFGAYLESLCANLQDFQEKGEFEITLICTAEPMILELDLVTSLGIIVAEVTSNAYLHAFPARPGTIRVTLVQKDGMGILTIADDGTGFVEKAASKRHGVGLIKRLMEQAKGTAQLKSDQGTMWILTFPLIVETRARAVA
jgi:two-component sensor histidine kinase